MTISNSIIAHNLQTIRTEIAKSAETCQRSADDITLLAVSKMKSIRDIEQAIEANQFEFGENYVQEGVEKIQYFSTTQHANLLCWHFIGPLQSNKSKYIAQYFSWLHTLDSTKLAIRLGDQRPLTLPPLNVLIQVNISGEKTKSGILLDEVEALVESILPINNLCLRGLMTIPAPLSKDGSLMEREQHYQSLRHLADKFEQLQIQYGQRENCQLDTLSMGMSDDLSLAIRAGSTLVRIGSAIFGART